MKLKRWVCPLCSNGVLAPSKPRHNDVRRYCLNCSKKTGKLVERTCPSLDTAKAERIAARKERAQKRTAREAERLAALPWAARTDLVRKEYSKLCKIAGLRHEPELNLRYSRTRSGNSGHCWGSHRIAATIGTQLDEASTKELLAHEIAHAVHPYDGHGDKWRSAFAAICYDAYGIVAKRDRHRYRFSRNMADAIRQKLTSQTFVL